MATMPNLHGDAFSTGSRCHKWHSVLRKSDRAAASVAAFPAVYGNMRFTVNLTSDCQALTGTMHAEHSNDL